MHPLLVQLCFMGRRELGAYVDRCVLALGDSEFNRQELDGARLPARPACCRSCPSFAHLDGHANRHDGRQFDDELDEHPVCRPGDPEQADRGPHPRSSTPTRRASTRGRGCCSWAPTAASSATSRCCSSWWRSLGVPDVHFIGPRVERGAVGVLRRRRRVPLRQRARGLLRAARRGLLQAHARAGLRGTAVPATMDGGGVLYDEQDPADVAALSTPSLDDEGLQERILAGAGRGARRGSRHRTSAARCCGSSTRSLAAPPGVRAAGVVRLLGAVRHDRASSRRSGSSARRSSRPCRRPLGPAASTVAREP